jgi:acyl dehydratase
VAAPTVLDGLDAVRAAAGASLGTSGWAVVGADRVAEYAAATGGEAGEAGGAGEAIPPLLLLSLTNYFLPQLVEVHGVTAGVNYGTEEVRFPAVAMTGQRLRATATMEAVVDVPGGVQARIRISIEAEGTPDPVCVVYSLSRWIA